MASLPVKGRRFFAVANVAAAAIVALAVFRGLPARWWPVDVGAAIVALLLAAAGLALFVRHRRAALLARLASFVVLGLGLTFTAALVMTASWLATVYGPVGKGGAAVFALFVLLGVPYLVILPAAELVWLGPARRRP